MLLISNFYINLLDNALVQIGIQKLKDTLLESLPRLGLIQTVRKPTRHTWKTESSLIDHSWISDMNKSVQRNNYETVSDHYLIVTTVTIKGNVISKEITKSTSFKEFNEEYF